MRLSSIRRTNGTTIENMKKTFRLNFKDAPKYLNTVVKPEHKEVVYKKIVDLNNFYTRILGLDEVKAAQDKVTNLQDQLVSIQEKRREVGRQLAEVRRKASELQDQIHKVNRQDDIQKFLALMKEETEVSKLEHEIQHTFQEYDHAEREIFTAFANAIRDSHEKQRAQLEYTKYFGIILSIMGSFLAFCYTTFRKRDLKYFLENSVGAYNINSEELKQYLESSDKKLDRVVHFLNEDNLKILEVLNKNSSQLKSLLGDKSDTKESDMKTASDVTSNSDNDNCDVSYDVPNQPHIISDGKSLSLSEPYVFEENRFIRYALYAGLGLLLLRIIAPN